MRQATVRDLRYRFSEIENLLQEGEEIQIVKRNRIVARLAPARRTIPPKHPNFLARLKKIYGAKRLEVSGSDLLASERDRF
jgi:antitoxin (DNA-binding transcriptional repressor) of toxin-antitoxin stability system